MKAIATNALNSQYSNQFAFVWFEDFVFTRISKWEKFEAAVMYNLIWSCSSIKLFAYFKDSIDFRFDSLVINLFF